MSEEIRRKILDEAPWKQIGKIDTLLVKLIEEARKEAIISLLKLPIVELRKIVPSYGAEMEKKLEDQMRNNLKEITQMMKERTERLQVLVEEHAERLESFIFPTDDDKRIHEMYENLPKELREKRPIVLDIPSLEELPPYTLDMKISSFYSKIEEARRKIAEIGGFISINELEEKTGIPSHEIDEALEKAGFLKQSERLPNGQKIVAYKLPIDEVWLRKKQKKFEEEVRLERKRIEKRRKEMLKQLRELQRY